MAHQVTLAPVGSKARICISLTFPLSVGWYGRIINIYVTAKRCHNLTTNLLNKWQPATSCTAVWGFRVYPFTSVTQSWCFLVSWDKLTLHQGDQRLHDWLLLLRPLFLIVTRHHRLLSLNVPAQNACAGCREVTFIWSVWNHYSDSSACQIKWHPETPPFGRVPVRVILRRIPFHKMPPVSLGQGVDNMDMFKPNLAIVMPPESIFSSLYSFRTTKYGAVTAYRNKGLKPSSHPVCQNSCQWYLGCRVRR